MNALLHRTNRIASRLLEWITVLLMICLTIIVILAVLARLMGHSFSWYDEVAAIFLLLFATIVFFDQLSSRFRNRLTEGA